MGHITSQWEPPWSPKEVGPILGPKQGFSDLSLPIPPSPNHVRTTFLQSSGGLRGLSLPPPSPPPPPPPPSISWLRLEYKGQGPTPTPTMKAHPRRMSALFPLTTLSSVWEEPECPRYPTEGAMVLGQHDI
ncbi:unnamed protein product [Rangifer tarandus platyrhynchus]|uniref:Uncharacterized protein n=1 Tax=Rangifer tarandus platyrhynchus TaxID=3082113 RepID=A0ABN8YUS1_RANTA|nr:unnamed protein product [Rangifer tarandus platyrhynchus]